MGVGHHEREEHGARPRRERHVEGRARVRQAERKREPPGEALRGARVLLRRPESLDPAECVPLDQRGVGPPRTRHQLTAQAPEEASEHPGEPFPVAAETNVGQGALSTYALTRCPKTPGISCAASSASE